MSRFGYRHNNAIIRQSDAKIRRVVATKSAAQLEREREEAERDRDIRQLLRAGEADNRPVWRNR